MHIKNRSDSWVCYVHNWQSLYVGIIIIINILFYIPGDFNIDKLNFQWSDEGIFGMSLTPVGKDGYRILHFSPLASNREFAISTQILQNSSKTEDSYHDFYYLEERGKYAQLEIELENKHPELVESYFYC